MALLLIPPLTVLLIAYVSLVWPTLSRSHNAGFVGWLQGQLGQFVHALEKLPVTGLIISLTRQVAHYVGSLFLATVQPAIGFFASLTQWEYNLAKFAFLWPVELYKAMTWAYRVVIPHRVASATRPLARQQVATRATDRAQSKAIAHTRESVKPIAHREAVVTVPRVTIPYVHDWRWLHHRWHALTQALGLAGVAGLAGDMPYGLTIRNLRLRLRKLEKLSLGGLAAGALAIGLARLGLTHLRCNNNSRFGRALCRTPLNFFNDLLGLLADVWVLDNICGLLPALERAASFTGIPLVNGLTDLAAALPDCQKDKPGLMSGPALTIPPLYSAAPAIPAV